MTPEQFEKGKAFCATKGYKLVDKGNGHYELLPTEEKRAEIIAKNKAIGRYIESDENLRALGLK